MKKQRNLHLTIYDGDKPDDKVYDVKVKEGKKKAFWKIIDELCEDDPVE